MKNYLYNGTPASSRNHNTIYILSLGGAIKGHVKTAFLPSIASIYDVSTTEIENKIKLNHLFIFIILYSTCLRSKIISFLEEENKL